MKESTIFVTAEFTFIAKHDNDVSLEISKNQIADFLKTSCNADDVIVKSAKLFEGEPK